MLKFIRKLQSRSEEDRKLIVMIALVVSMTIIIGIWLATFALHNSDKKNNIEKETIKNKGQSPFLIMKESFTETFKNIGNSISGMDLSDAKKDLNKEELQKKNTVDLTKKEEIFNDNLKEEPFNFNEF